MKKNILTITGFIIIILFVFSNFVIADVYESGTITATTVRLREEPDSLSDTLQLIGLGETVEILDEDGDWYKVEYEGITGYISKDYVLLDDSNTSESSNVTTSNTTSSDSNSITETDDSTSIEDTAQTKSEEIDETTEADETEIEEETDDYDDYSIITLSEDVDIRYMPNFNSNILSTIGSGSEVTVIMTLNKWVKITDGNVTGWVIRQNI